MILSWDRLGKGYKGSAGLEDWPRRVRAPRRG